MWNKIRKHFYSINGWVRFIALVGLVLAILHKYVLTDVAVLATVVSIYTYVMYAAAGAFVLISVAMIIRTIIKFRLIGLLRALFRIIVTSILFLMYANLVGIITLF